MEMGPEANESKDHHDALPEVRDRLQQANNDWSATLPAPLWTVYKDAKKAKK
jgi:hypothetical protein